MVFEFPHAYLLWKKINGYLHDNFAIHAAVHAD